MVPPSSPCGPFSSARDVPTGTGTTRQFREPEMGTRNGHRSISLPTRNGDKSISLPVPGVGLGDGCRLDRGRPRGTRPGVYGAESGPLSGSRPAGNPPWPPFFKGGNLILSFLSSLFIKGRSRGIFMGGGDRPPVMSVYEGIKVEGSIRHGPIQFQWIFDGKLLPCHCV